VLYNTVMSNSKQIILPVFDFQKEKNKKNNKNNKTNKTNTTVELAKPKQKRVITNTTKWTFTEAQLSLDNQIEYLKQIRDGTIAEANAPICKTICSQIHQKLYGYKFQDAHKKNENIKNIAKTTEFLSEAEVIETIIECKSLCFYCNQPVQVLYEFCREPKQWTLERIDNTLGHTKENVVIACLHCNLHRKTMYHERYLFTKQLDIKKVL